MSPGFESYKTAHHPAIVVDRAGQLLLPLGAACLLGNADAERLTRWRNANKQAFRSEFTATPEGTHRWLQTYVNDQPERLLVYVATAGGNPGGLLGASIDHAEAGVAWIESVTKGDEADAHVDMRAALEAFVSWLATEVSAKVIRLNVFADATPAVRLYWHCGFAPKDLTPLAPTRSDGRTEWHVAGAGDRIERFYLVMENSRT